MDFLKCPIAGLQYGTRASDVELAAAKQLAETWAMAESIDRTTLNLSLLVCFSFVFLLVVFRAIKGFSFEDSCFIKRCWMEEPNTDVILLFYRILAICYASVPEQNEETRGLNYESESPDEVSFLVAAKRIRLSFSKELNQVFLQEIGLPFKWFLFCRRKEKSFFLL
ncbi:hypothetical protein MTR67_011734 [Solanum verrucosum]|uniref:Uncharacterized protein n=1 Tax=Solanum verrucosum TaxID=315347 RepID=A0AAF0QEE9_SOLVR|nr:hypothetical protein MTR67_011734 [Solanum verrucosum]